MKRVVVTGAGVVSCVGSTLDTFWKSLCEGQSGITTIDSFDTTGLTTTIAGRVKGFNPDQFLPAKIQRRLDPFIIFAKAAAHMALEDSGLDLSRENPERAGAIVGSGVGGLQSFEENFRVLIDRGPGKCSPFMLPKLIANLASGQLAIDYNLQGPNYCIVSACSTAAHAIGNSFRCIQHGEADIMFAGGTEAAVCLSGISGFATMRALSTRNNDPQGASRPFDKDRDGFVMSEGAAVIILEEMERARARGAKIYAEIAGYGMTCDAHHITAPSPEGAGAARAMSVTMRDAGVRPEEVNYINAHGTGTPLNDPIETNAIKTALGDAAHTVMISSTKSMTGHALGAAAGIETLACLFAMRDGIVPPTINYTTPDPACDLDYVPNTARNTPVKVCLNNAFGFGGHNVCLCFKAV